MQINIGNKIRELRHRNGRKQEELANALGVTPQAVSRWEQGGGYPDMEMIPAIANYFNVSIDELFGYSKEREEKLKSILTNADEVIKAQGRLLAKGNGDITDCVEMLRLAAEEFPSEPEILLRLGHSLYVLGWQKCGANVRYQNDSEYIGDDVEYNLQNDYWQEAILVYERVMKMDITVEQRGMAVSSIISILKKLGKCEKAKTIAEGQGSILYCKEILLPRTTDGEEQDRYQGETIIALLHQLYAVTVNSVAAKSSVYSTEYARQVLLALADLFEKVFCDGRCGDQHETLSYIYLFLAGYEAKYGDDIKKAVYYFDRAFEHHNSYCDICEKGGEYSYSAPLLSKVVIPETKLPPASENFWKVELEGMDENLRKELRNNSKYAECFK